MLLPLDGSQLDQFHYFSSNKVSKLSDSRRLVDWIQVGFRVQQDSVCNELFSFFAIPQASVGCKLRMDAQTMEKICPI